MKVIRTSETSKGANGWVSHVGNNEKWNGYVLFGQAEEVRDRATRQLN